jgi:hypothetical protein
VIEYNMSYVEHTKNTALWGSGRGEHRRAAPC